MNPYYLNLSMLLPPLLAILLFIYLRNKYDKERYLLLLKAFLLGMVSVVIAYLAQYIAEQAGYGNLRSLKRILFFTFFIIGFFAELSKLIVLRFFIFPKKIFDGPSDGLIFGVIVGLGFATLANVLYVLELFDNGNMNSTATHAFTIGPASIIFGIILGFFVGLAKLRTHRFLNMIAGLLAAAFFHGLYDFCLMTRDYKLLSIFISGSMIVVVLLVLKTAGGKFIDQRTEVDNPDQAV